MMNNNMTAKVSCFVRAYHNENNKYRLFNDDVAKKLLGNDYEKIAINMINGIDYFKVNFKGSDEEKLKYIVNCELSPTVLGRSIFTEKSLNNSYKLGCRQYLIFASGYDTFAYRNKYKDLKVFEMDKENMIKDKKERLIKANIDNSMVNYITCDFTKDNWINNIIHSSFKKNEISFCSLLGISYYLEKEEFSNMIKCISDILSEGSTIIFDYPNNNGNDMRRQEELAKEINEEMKAKCSYQEIEKILSDNNIYIYEHLNDNDINSTYFYNYNTLNPNYKIIAPKGVSYCLGVKKLYK